MRRSSSSYRAIFPPAFETVDKGHGRIDQRRIWTKAIDGYELGIAGAAQVFRIENHSDHLRGGKVYKTTEETYYGVTSLYDEECSPKQLLGLSRGYWGIETKQHYRRDVTQGEDACHVRHWVCARNLSLMRSMAIFLFTKQQNKRHGKKTLPDWLKKNHRDPNPLLRKLVGSKTTTSA